MPGATQGQDRQPDATTIRQVLALRLGPDNPLNRPDATIRDYLGELLAQILLGRADAKYGIGGGDDWQYDLYVPMRDAGLIPAWEDGWGLTDEGQVTADMLLAAAARALVAPSA